MAARARVLVPLLALLALLGTGCQAHLLLDVAVNGDGGGALTVALAADADLLAEARARGFDPLDGLAQAGGRLAGEGWQVSDTTGQDGTREVRLTAAFAGPEEFNTLAADVAAALAAPEVVLLDGLRLALTDGQVRLEGGAGLVPTEAVADLGLEPDAAVAVLREERLLIYEVTATLPGEVVETTARGADVMPLRWTVEAGERVEILAVADLPPSEWVVLALSGAAGGLAALLVLGVLTARRRRRRRWFR